LLALSTLQRAHLTFSSHTLASHGGAAGNAHGACRVVFHQGEDVALFREPTVAADSALARFLASRTKQYQTNDVSQIGVNPCAKP